MILCSLWLVLLWPSNRLWAERDLETGTFLTRDPAGMVDGPNLYAYVRQNPWTHFDPEGLAEELGDYPGQFRVVRGADGSIAVSGSMIIHTGPGLLNAYNAVPNPAEVAAYNFEKTGNVKYLENNPAIKAGGLALATQGMNDPRGESERLAGIVGSILSFGAGPRMAEATGPLSPEGQSARRIAKTNCFFAGTPVATPDGWKNIEDIREDDTVFAFDETTGQVSEQRVTATLRHQTYWWIDIAVAGETITATRTHRFWVDEENGWKEAKTLQVGEHLRRIDGSIVAISAVRFWEASALMPTFNLEVGINHTYFVGIKRILVHNGDIDPLPKEALPPKNYADGRTSESIMVDHKIPQGTNLPGVQAKSNLNSVTASENLAKSFHDKETVRYVENLRAAGKTEPEIVEILKAEHLGESAIGENVAPAKMNKMLENIPDQSGICPR